MVYRNARLGLACALALILVAQTAEVGRSMDAGSGTGTRDAATGGVRVYDTGDSALSAETVGARAGWRELAAGEVDPSFKGAACVSNDYLTLVLREKSRGPVCYYRLGSQMVEGPTLVVVRGGEMSRMITAVRVIENKPAGVVVEADTTVGPSEKITARYLVRGGQPIVEVQPREGVEGVLVEAPGKYAVLPDIFGGDLVLSAGDAAASELRFPSERMLLQLLDGGNAIVECVWPSRDQQVRLFLGNQAFTASEIACSKAKGERVVVAVLAAPAIWRAQAMAELDPVRDRKLDWRVPFPALWRADFRRTDGYIDSWKCIIRKDKDTYERFGITTNLNKSRTVWTTARGSFAYPACIEGDTCFLRKTHFEAAPEIRYDDSRSALIYPYRALSGGPAGVFGAVDVWCDALADAPRASLDDELRIRDVPRDKWPATCDVTAEYEDIFDSGEERAKKAHMLERLDAMDNFVIGIRSRMNEYLDWCRKARAFCAQTKAEQPQLAALADEMDGDLAKFDQVYQRRKLGERNPAAVHALVEKVAALIDSDEAGKGEKAKEMGRDTRTIGGNQDDSIGEFRMLTKEVRQRAGYCMVEAKDDASFEFARAIRQRTMEMLQSGFVHEFATTD